ncbi:MAG: hypothetical protein J6T76_01270 [Paludibacteraceae bacterium]|nr:hypothetical protein [Paludibacteraceae bacterium]
MKKNMYIQPTIELVKIQQCRTLCESLTVGNELGGGGDPENPQIIP